MASRTPTLGARMEGLWDKETQFRKLFNFLEMIFIPYLEFQAKNPAPGSFLKDEDIARVSELYPTQGRIGHQILI